MSVLAQAECPSWTRLLAAGTKPSDWHPPVPHTSPGSAVAFATDWTESEPLVPQRDSDTTDQGLIEEQRAYYRARAPQYDDWWQHRGRYDRGPELAGEWDREVATVAAALSAFGATGEVLELAGGTGWWTERLARTADRLTVVDSSLEAIDRNRARVGRADVSYVVADLFAWRPGRTYDVVFFSFWLSHVPRSRLDSFWSFVGSCLKPGGRVFLIDNRDDPLPGSDTKDPYVVEYASDLHVRRLDDGSEYRVVKVKYEPEELATLLEREGWRAQIAATRWFVYGSAVPT